VEIQIIYYSKYGSTREIAESLAKKLETQNVSDVTEQPAITGDLIIIGSGIYKETAHKDILLLLADEGKTLQDKEVAVFVVCANKKRTKIKNMEGGGPVYIEKMEKALRRTPIAAKIFGGRMILDKMDDEDRERTEQFAKRVGMPLKDVDIMSVTEVDEFVQELKGKFNL